MIGLPVIETERLVLRPVQIGDAPDMFEYASQDEVTKYLTWNTHQTIEETKDAISNFFLKKGADQFESYAVVLKENNKMIGTCDFVSFNKASNSCEIGYAFNKDYWGLGYATEACERLIRFGFTVLGLDYLTVFHAKENMASQNVILKCGFKYLNETLDYLPLKDKKVEVLNYRLSKEEYLEEE